MNKLSINDIKRFSSKYDVDEQGCWLWRGHKSVSGYGMFYYGTSSVRSHRASYVIYKGEIPHRLVIDHLCRNRHCVNPDHLEAVSAYENIMRGRGQAVINREKLFCSNGHKFTPKSSFMRFAKHNGRYWRVCRICHNKRQAEYRKRKVL